ncbi:MAG: LacI family DNA-binding transcriptional regulator [Planctomycetota bacterium]
MATVSELAKRTGVSPATVSRVLNNRPGTSAAARKAVVAAAAEAGIRSRAAESAALRVALIYAMGNPAVPLQGYDADVAAGLFERLGDHDGQLVVLRLSDRRHRESYRDFFFRSHIDSAVLRVNEATRHVARDIADEALPCVVASDRYRDDNIGWVGYDSRTGTLEAIDYLVNLGHQSIAYVQPLPPVNHDFKERHEAFREGSARHGLDPDSCPVVNAEFSRAGGGSAIDQLMTRQRPPTAVIFATPVTTVGGIQRAMQRGLRVPDELSIVGFDDGRLRHDVFPTYSAVCQNARRIGSEAARIALSAARSQQRFSPVEQLILPSAFEANETTGPAPVNP